MRPELRVSLTCPKAESSSRGTRTWTGTGLKWGAWPLVGTWARAERGAWPLVGTWAGAERGTRACPRTRRLSEAWIGTPRSRSVPVGPLRVRPVGPESIARARLFAGMVRAAFGAAFRAALRATPGPRPG